MTSSAEERIPRPFSICMLSNLYYPVASGSSTQSRALSRELLKRGHRPFVITAHVDKSVPSEEEIDGVPIYRLPCLKMPKMSIALDCPWLSWTFMPGNLERISRIFQKHDPDIMNLHNHMFDLSFSAVWLRKQFKIPLVLTMHTIIRHANPIYNLLLYPADRIFLRCSVARHADLMICPDLNMQKYVSEAFPCTRAALIPYGITSPGDADERTMDEIRGKYGLEGKRVILSLGNIHLVRDRRDEIAAMPSVLKKFPDAVLLIVGKENMPGPRNRAKRLGIGDSVIFAGSQPHGIIPSFMGVADLEVHLFYQDAVENTGLGIATQEAMAFGLPIINSANPDSLGRGLLRDGENIVFVERGRPAGLAGRIIDLLGDGARRMRIGRAAKDLIESHLGWENICRLTLDAYRSAKRTMR